MVKRIFGLVLRATIVAFFVVVMVSPVLAAESQIDLQKDDHDDDSHFLEESYSHFVHEGCDDVHKCKCPVPDSYTEISDLTIDRALIEATPHWFLLAAGKSEQKALLNLIKRADVSRQKRSAWTFFMMKEWMKYPVKYVKTTSSAKLILGKSASKFSLTPKENATFQEIELYIAEDMEKTSLNIVAKRSDIILPQWAQTEHSSYTSIACEKENIPGDLAKIMTDNAPDPDDWYNYPGGFLIHSRDHGFVPTPPFPNGIGNAPYRCGEYGWLATTNFQSHHYDTAFTNLGYSSHFMEDVGIPYHTPQVQIIPLQFIDDPTFFKYVIIGTEVINYKELHDNYEGFVNNFWSASTLPLSTDPNKDTFYEIADSVTDYVVITDPVNSAKTLAEESWNMNPGLFWDCYWHYTKTGRYNFETNPIIVSKTINRVIQTERYTRGLVHYLTGGKPLIVSITASTGPGGTITPSGMVSVTYGTPEPYSITSNTGYVIDDIKVDGNSLGGANQKSFLTTVQAVLSDHTISATFKPENKPGKNYKLFDGFNTVARGQVLHPYSGTLNWDGVGKVYLTGGDGYINTWADDAFDITTDSGFRSFTRSGYYEGIPDITPILHPGANQITIDVRDIYGWSIGYHETWVYFDNGVSPVMMSATTGPEESPAPFLNTTETEPIIAGLING